MGIKRWLKAAGIRALKTFAQTCVAMIPVGISINEVSWAMVLGTGALSAVVSMLTSIAGLPEIALQDELVYSIKNASTIPDREDNSDENQEDPS